MITRRKPSPVAQAPASGEPPPQVVEWLTACAAAAPERSDGEPNLLPTALWAMHKLGAAPERLAAFAQAAAAAQPPGVPAEPWPAGDPWPDRLGQREALAAYRSLFAEWIAQEGATDMLGQVLPQLMPGVSAEGFQPLVRTASAVRCGHLGELASALAWWASRHQRLGALHNRLAGTARAPATEDPVSLLRELRAGRSREPLFSRQMLDAAHDGRVNRVAARLMVDGHAPERLARAAAHACVHTGSAMARRLLTSAHALRVLTRFLDEPLAAWAWYWQAFAHGVVAARLQPAEELPLRSWSTITRQALARGDGVVIQFVEACREEERAYARRGETLWRLAASQAVCSP